jgi:TRAP-type C4-dicarboxylate transport system permease small subunit
MTKRCLQGGASPFRNEATGPGPMLRTFDRILIAVTATLVVALTALMTAVVLIGVFTRYMLGEALPWPEELARYTMTWLSWIGGGLALRRGAHIATDLAINALPERARKAVLFVGNVLVAIFLVILIVYGWQLVGRAGFQTTAALGVSMQIPYAALPIGAVLMLYHLAIVTFFPSLEVQRDTELQT